MAHFCGGCANASRHGGSSEANSCKKTIPTGEAPGKAIVQGAARKGGSYWDDCQGNCEKGRGRGGVHESFFAICPACSGQVSIAQGGLRESFCAIWPACGGQISKV